MLLLLLLLMMMAMVTTMLPRRCERWLFALRSPRGRSDRRCGLADTINSPLLSPLTHHNLPLPTFNCSSNACNSKPDSFYG